MMKLKYLLSEIYERLGKKIVQESFSTEQSSELMDIMVEILNKIESEHPKILNDYDDAGIRSILISIFTSFPPRNNANQSKYKKYMPKNATEIGTKYLVPVNNSYDLNKSIWWGQSDSAIRTLLNRSITKWKNQR